MKSYKNKVGLTLVEILVVLVVIILLVSMVISIAARIDNQSRERLTENTFALLDAALGQFRDYGYEHKDYSVYSAGEEREFYRSLVFPIDCNGFDADSLEGALADALDVDATDVSISGDHNDVYSGSEAMYFFLSRVPESRKTLDKIDGSLITGKDENRQDITITIDGKAYPLLRVVDPWGITMRYDYYDENESDFGDREEGKKTFPVITSAGPDREFGTADDITSR